jgi:hypothetical protein
LRPVDEEMAMKRILVTAAALAAFSVIPLTAAACGAYDEAMATTTPPAVLASTPPAASKVPAVTVAKTPISKTTKQAAAKVDARSTDTTKVAATSGN